MDDEAIIIDMQEQLYRQYAELAALWHFVNEYDYLERFPDGEENQRDVRLAREALLELV